MAKINNNQQFLRYFHPLNRAAKIEVPNRVYCQMFFVVALVLEAMHPNYPQM